MNPTVGIPAAQSTPRGWHPDVWALQACLLVARCRLPYETGHARLVDGIQRWVKLTGKGQAPQGSWWAQTLALVEATVKAVDEPGTTQLLAPWCGRTVGKGVVSRTGFVPDGGV